MPSGACSLALELICWLVGLVWFPPPTAVARFDFSWGDAAYHQETLENLKLSIKSTKKLCAVSSPCSRLVWCRISERMNERTVRKSEVTIASLSAYQVMLDTVGPELQVVNKSETPISLEENGTVVLTPHRGQDASSSLLPINFSGLAKVSTRAHAVLLRSDIRCCIYFY
jgi:pyruvate kinase